jgi:hypothetical protein
MRAMAKKHLKATAVSMGVGLAVFGLAAYALMLFSVTHTIALKGEPAPIDSR